MRFLSVDFVCSLSLSLSIDHSCRSSRSDDEFQPRSLCAFNTIDTPAAQARSSETGVVRPAPMRRGGGLRDVFSQHLQPNPSRTAELL